jgi:hypothetical protein
VLASCMFQLSVNLSVSSPDLVSRSSLSLSQAARVARQLNALVALLVVHGANIRSIPPVRNRSDTFNPASECYTFATLALRQRLLLKPRIGWNSLKAN